MNAEGLGATAPSDIALPAAAPQVDRISLRLKVGIGGAVLLALLLFGPARWAALPDLCFFHRETGLPCPGCGLTRSWAALVHLDLAAAFRYHLFGPPLFLFTGLMVLGGKWSAWIKRLPLSLAYLAGGLWLLYWGLRLAGLLPPP